MGSRPLAKVYTVQIPGQTQPSKCTKILRNPKFASYLWSSPQNQARSVKEVLLLSFKTFQKNCIGTIAKKEGQWAIQYLTYKQLQMMSKALARIIIDLKLANEVEHSPSKRLNVIGICSRSQVQCLIVMVACILYGIAFVPISTLMNEQEISYILNQSGIETLFCSDDFVTTLSKMKDSGKLKTVVSFGTINQQEEEIFKGSRIQVRTFTSLLEEGSKKKPYISGAIHPNQCLVIVYTAGTTGKPKGVMLSHLNMASDCAMIKACDDTRVYETDSYFAFMPFGHLAQVVFLIISLMVGGQVIFSSGNIERFSEEIKLAKPTVLASVPTLFQILYKKLRDAFEQIHDCKKTILDAAISHKIQNLLESGEYKHFFYDTLIFDKIKQSIGGKVRFFLTGFSNMDPDIQNFMKIVFEVPFILGYGLSESNFGSFSSDAVDPNSGHVGGPTSNTEFKLVDIPELNYSHLDFDQQGRRCPRGEIYLRGPGIFRGYFRDYEKTHEVLTPDNWLKTGDIGMILPENGALKVLGRRVNLMKISNGEYMVPQRIQQILGRFRGIHELCLCNNEQKEFIVAIVVPDKKSIDLIAKVKKIQGTFQSLCSNIMVRQEFINQLARFGCLKGLKVRQLPKNIFLCPIGFKQKGVLTYTLQIKRHELKRVFEQEISQMYQQGKIMGREQVYVCDVND